jgi:hypothetical protein
MTRLPETKVALPNGYWEAGACLRNAWVREIPEGDEELDDELGASALASERTSALLARCVSRLGESDCSGTDLVRSLSLGDREALLLHIRRITFGERMDCVLRCPDCSERVECELRVADLLLPAAEHRQRWHEETLTADGLGFRVRFRIPTAADLEAAIYGAPAGPEVVARTVLAGCVEWVRPEQEVGGADLAAAGWPADLVAQLNARIAELDPQAEISLQLTCPACGQTFASSLDTADYLLRERETRERRIYEEVHQLALAYHWSEGEILGMPRRRRRLYLDMLAGEI